MKFRKAQSDDLEAILQMFENTVHKVCIKDYTAAQIDAWIATVHERKDVWKAKIESQYFILVEDVKGMVGFGSLENGNCIDFMYVHYQKQGKGIAKQILKILEREALECGSTTLLSDVSITARPFFEKMGFKAIHPNHNLRKGQDLINYRMEKQL